VSEEAICYNGRRGGRRGEMKRTVAIALAALALAACTHSTVSFHASISPARGCVPFQATITAARIGKSYTFHLPHETIAQQSNVLVVTVDHIDWSATVETMCGGDLYSDNVHATGSNAPPRIERLIINGNKNLWYLMPFERTLLQFQVSPGAKVVDVDVWGSAFSQHYSVFCSPYDGTYHATYGQSVWDNACAVYPVYCSIPGELLPYAPTGLEAGYPYLSSRQTNAIRWGGSQNDTMEIPEQTGYVQVAVEGPYGQRSRTTIEIPIKAINFWDVPGDYDWTP